MAEPLETEVVRPARDRILNAAEARLLGRGQAGLVLAAVAEDACCSKGGLLYHFPSKEALVDGITRRMLDNFDRVQTELAEVDESRRGVWSRAYLRSTVSESGEPADASAQLMAGLLALVGNDSEKLEPLRERFGEWHARIENDGIEPETAVIVRLAADGLWLSALLGLPSPDETLLSRVISRLDDMTRGPVSRR
jgi:AcrR family transcriptional regulator